MGISLKFVIFITFKTRDKTFPHNFLTYGMINAYFYYVSSSKNNAK